jgi:hypothetical protein
MAWPLFNQDIENKPENLEVLVHPWKVLEASHKLSEPFVYTPSAKIEQGKLMGGI